MPTKGKKPTSKPVQKPKNPGFFERCGAKLDCAIAWLIAKIQKIRAFYNRYNEKYRTALKNHKPLRILPSSLIVLAFTAAVSASMIVKIIDSSTDIAYNGAAHAELTPTDPIYDGEISQEIRIDDIGEIYEIGLTIGTFMRRNDADYEFVLKRNDETIFSHFFSANNLLDGVYYRIKLNHPILLNQEDKYSFSIRAVRADKNNAVAFYRNVKTGDLVYSLSVHSNFYNFVILASIVFIAVFFVINFLINSGKIKTEFHFITTALVYIIPIVFLYPAYTTPDEPYHFLSAVRLAEYDWSKSPEWNSARVELALPSNRQCLGDFYANTFTPGLMTMEKLFQCLEPMPTTYDSLPIGNTTSRILAYFPSALGIILGDLFFDSPLAIYYAGRLTNVATTMCLIAFALSLLKKHRMILLAVVCIPMFIQQAISYSYDGLLNALCLVVIAYAIRLLTTDAIARKRDIIIMTVSIFLIGVIKLPYLIVAAPFLAVKPEKFGRTKATKWVLAVVMIVLALVPLLLDANAPKVATEWASESTGRGFPISTLVQHPLSVIKMVVYTLGKFMSFYITSTIGNFGWFYFTLDQFIIYSYLIFLLVVAFSEEEKNLSRIVRILALVAACVIIGSTFIIMYLTWTPTSQPFIEGVQGRYFLPVLPLILAAIIPASQYFKPTPSTYYSFFNVIFLAYVVTLITGFY